MSRHLRTYLESCQQIEPIEIGLLVRADNQLRSDLGELSDLCASIKLHGLLQPIIVRPKGSRFELICGNRRFEACRRLMKRNIDCVVKDLSDSEAFELSIIENIQRNTLSPVEEAMAYKKYVSEFGWGGISDLARKIGKSQEYVSHRIFLLNLPQEILSKVSAGEVSPSQAQELVWMREPESKNQLASLISSNKLTIKEIRRVRKNLEKSLSSREMKLETDFDSGFKKGSRTFLDKKAVEDAILGLRIALVRLDSTLSRTISQEVRNALMEQRYTLHCIIDELIGLKMKLHS